MSTIRSRENWKVSAVILSTLALINLIANFSLASQFGLYEDDYLEIIHPFTSNWHTLAPRLAYYVVHWPQGRPFYWISFSLLSWLAGNSGGIGQLYIIGFLFITAAAFSVQRLLQRFFSVETSLLAACFFIIYPPDVAKQIVIHQACFFLGTILAVWAITSYLDNRKIRATLLAIVILLTYEPYFLILPCAVFLSFALMENRKWKDFVIWGLLLACSLVLVLWIRRNMGEERVVALFSGPGQAFLNAARAMCIGPATAIMLILARPLEGILHGNGLQWVFAFSSGALLWMVMTLLGFLKPSENPPIRSGRWIALAAIVAAVLPYAYRFVPDYFPPNVTIGRLSALHQVSALGFSLGIALLFTRLLQINSRLVRPARFLACCLLISNIPFALEIQQTQYVRNAKQQRLFWNDLLSQIGDLEDGMPIIVDFDSCIRSSDFLGTEGLNVYWLINYPVNTISYLVETPKDWKKVPRIFAYYRSAKQWRSGDALAFESSIFTSDADPVFLRNGEYLYFVHSNGHLRRSMEKLSKDGFVVSPHPVDSRYNVEFPRTSFGQTFLSEDLHLWKALVPSNGYPRP